LKDVYNLRPLFRTPKHDSPRAIRPLQIPVGKVVQCSRSCRPAIETNGGAWHAWAEQWLYGARSLNRIAIEPGPIASPDHRAPGSIRTPPIPAGCCRESSRW
jgi:hypothetical protein